jgi:RNA methyltransferase, TrmH family
VTEALKSTATVDEVFATPEAVTPEVRALVDTSGISLVLVSEAVLGSLCDTSTPQGMAAVVRMGLGAVDEVPADASLVLVLAEVRDPGNAGTLVRSALAVGASSVVFTRGSVDPWHPKTVRAAAGTLFHIPVIRAHGLEEAASELRAAGFVLIGADASSRRPLDSVDLTRRIAFVVGNEAWGLPSDMRHLLDEDIGIPMPGPVESLNVGIAGSILLFETVRQRRLSSPPR